MRNNLLQVRSLLADVLALDPQGATESGSELLESTALAEEVSRLLDVVKVRRAGEIADRSRRELGNESLATLGGHANALALLRTLTRSGFHEAARRIRVGTVMNEAAAALMSLGPARAIDRPHDEVFPDTPADTSLHLISEALAEGVMGVEAADRVIRTFEEVVNEVDPGLLASATATLINEASHSDTDQIGTMARGVRDTLDRAGIADREEYLRSKRSLRSGRVIDGLRRVSLVLDPESDVRLIGAIDAVMSPRWGGPRFRDSGDGSEANSAIDDSRTNEQMALDVLVDLVTVGADADPTVMPTGLKPAVRVTMTIDGLVSAVADHAQRAAAPPETGVALFDGHPELVSARTARRFLCNQGALPVVLGGDSQPLDLGRSRRLFSPAQRTALSVRDGGCRWPECDRPPSWTESHHIVEYQNGGRTDLKDGIALCRRHHLLMHNNGWVIQRDDRTDPVYWLRPPQKVDPNLLLIPMPSKANPVLQPRPRRKAQPCQGNVPPANARNQQTFELVR